MASFSRRLYESLTNLNTMSQLLLVVNNIKGITEEDRAQLKSLALQQDSRLIAAVEVFKLDRSSENLVDTLRSILGVCPSPIFSPKSFMDPKPAPKRLNRQDVDRHVRELFVKQMGSSTVLDKSLNQIAEQAVNHCFEQADRDRDGLISIDEFNRWVETEYTPKSRSVSVTPVPQAKAKEGQNKLQKQQKTQLRSGKPPAAGGDNNISERFEKNVQPALKTKEVDLMRLRDVLGLGNSDPRQVVSRVKLALKKTDYLLEKEFIDLICKLDMQGDGWQKMRKESALCDLFKIVDTDNSGRIDKDELFNSLIVLSGGNHDEKIEALFMLYDRTGEGLITFNEVLKHQQAIFRLMFVTRPALQSRCGETPDNMARLVTEYMFQAFDFNKSNLISLEEYKCWFYKREVTDEISEEKERKLQAYTKRREDLFQEIAQIKKQLVSEDMENYLDTIKERTGIDKIHVYDAVKIFRDHNVSGFYTRAQFREALIDLWKYYGDGRRKTEDEVFHI
jgi:Ca2+-binding EF-hand superfamily protein